MEVSDLVEIKIKIKFEKGFNFESALEGIEEMERLWVIFAFHRAKNWKPKVTPPRGGVKRGLFATRTPHRPNAIGFSAVKLKRVEGLKLYIEDHDLLDGTPVLDIKPYLHYVDSFPDASCGWLENVAVPQVYEIELSEQVRQQFNWLLLQGGPDLLALSSVNLRINPRPAAGNRISELSPESYEMAVKTWRLQYTLNGNKLLVCKLTGGYDAATLAGEKTSRWDDVELHRHFIARFSQ